MTVRGEVRDDTYKKPPIEMVDGGSCACCEMVKNRHAAAGHRPECIIAEFSRRAPEARSGSVVCSRRPSHLLRACRVLREFLG